MAMVSDYPIYRFSGEKARGNTGKSLPARESRRSDVFVGRRIEEQVRQKDGKVRKKSDEICDFL
jgi:hypothetical protein